MTFGRCDFRPARVDFREIPLPVLIMFRHLALSLLLLSPAVLAEQEKNAVPEDISNVLAAITAEAGKTYGTLETVNGSITIESGASAKAVEVVNGSISVGDGAKVGSIESVNGGIRIGKQALIESAETVNGAISIGSASIIQGDATTVNGSLRMAAQSQVKGDAQTVNGDITLEKSRVGGRLITTRGDILVGAASQVDGGILVEKPAVGWFNWKAESITRMEIGPGAIVNGTLKFEREVDLWVHKSAKIGEVIGAKIQLFETDRAPD